jgi:uncharacterized protein (TIGR02145 family)
MKKFKCLFTILIIYSQTFAQSITLNYTAMYDSAYIQMDSIEIYNVNRNTSEFIYFPNNSITLNSTVEIQEYDGLTKNKTLRIETVFPNPYNHMTEIVLHSNKQQNVHFRLYDVLGRVLLQHQTNAYRGRNTYQLSGGNQGMYFLSVFGETNTESFTIIKNNDNNTPYFSISSNTINTLEHFASKLSKTNFQWVPGDQLIFICYSTLGMEVVKDFVYDSPIVNTSYTFHIDTGLCETPYAIDGSGNIYRTVKIGSQCWLKETLRTSKYNNGNIIPMINDSIQWGNITTPAYCYIHNDPSTVDLYGKLYNGFTMTTDNPCPNGWHIPTITEWSQLTSYLSNNGHYCGTNTSFIAKAIASTTGWSFATPQCSVGNQPSTNNSSGLSIMPAGFRNGVDGIFYTQNERAYIWTTDVVAGFPNSYYYIFVSYESASITNTFMSGLYQGHTIRCVKN